LQNGRKNLRKTNSGTLKARGKNETQEKKRMKERGEKFKKLEKV
jgi:hypothetical protein